MFKYMVKFVWNKFMWLYSGILLYIKKMINGYGIVLINAPTHGNIGDQAIAAAELEFIHRIIPRKKVLVITENEWKYHKQVVVSKYISKRQLILIHGGGYIGTLWEDQANTAFQIMLLFPDNPKILMPQTAYYDNPSRLEKDKELFSIIKNLEVFARDEKSFVTFTNELGLPCDRVHLVPDIVTTFRMPKNIKSKRNNDLLFVMRSDIEKMTSNEFLPDMLKFVKKFKVTYKVTDMFEKKFFYPFKHFFIRKKIKEFVSSKCVITDRLHGMYFSAITGTPCIVFDNISKKVSGGYMWLNEYTQIKFIKNDIELHEQLLSIFDNNCSTYMFKYLDDKFYELINVIKYYA